MVEEGDAPNTVSGTFSASLGNGGTFNGALSANDIDIIKISVNAGEVFTVATDTNGSGSVSDTFIVLYDANGNEIATDDDDGPGFFSSLTYTATAAIYYVGVMTYQTRHGYSSTDTGNYKLDLTVDSGNGTGTGLPSYTNDQIADQLINGYWESTSRSARSFGVDVSEGPATIHVSYSALSIAGQWFAKEALDVWSAVTGIQFSTDTPTGGQRVQITFDDEYTGAYASASVNSSGITQSVFINISENWIASEQYDLDSYSMQTYVHEIGHALGLGHAGNYNAGSGGSVSYASSAEFINDSWQATVMSYFSQSENTESNATRAYLLTPMISDILAMQTMYGTSGQLRLGDTVYGVGSTAGDYYDHLEANWKNMAFTIIDDGGIDTLDFSDTTEAQSINLNAETYSSVGGESGNMSIARGTIIENVVSGSGDDHIIGNSEDNVITGGAGNDTIEGGVGKDTVRFDGAAGAVNASLNNRQATGDGNDRLIRIENLVGSNHDDRLTGDERVNQLEGGKGDDILKGRQGDDRLAGGLGNDTLEGGDGNDRLEGDDQNDLLKGEAGADKLFGGNGDDRLVGGTGNDELDGDDGRDVLLGQAGADILNGGGGQDKLYGGRENDVLNGGSGADVLLGGVGADTLHGGEGNDVLRGGSGADVFVFQIGGDHDRIKDWANGEDRVDLSSWSFESFADVLALVRDQSSAMKLEFHDGSILTIESFASVLFDESDVIL